MYSRVYVEINNVCNMNCSFCHGHKRKAKMMSFDEFDHILDQLGVLTEYIYYHLMGEPLLHPDLKRFICRANEKGYKSQITTNGTLLNKMGEMLIDSRVHKVNVSLHSFEDGDEADFLRYLTDISEFAYKASKNGTIVVLRLWNNGFDNGRNDSIIEFLKQKLDGEWVPNTKGIRVREKLFIEYGDRFMWPDSKIESFGEDVFCYGLRDHFGILADGSVVPCCLDADGIITLGNVFDQSLEDILNSNRAKNIFDGFSKRKACEDLCKKCGYARRFSNK